MTMTLISTTTVGAGGASSITFSSFASTATDLMLIISARTNASSVSDGIVVRFNGDTNAANYYMKRLMSDGGTASSSNSTNFFAGFASGNTATANSFGNSTLYIPNYSGSQYKNAQSDGTAETGASTMNHAIYHNSWLSTSAITSIVLTPQFGTSFLQYTVASLYSITKGSGGATVA